MNRSNVGEKKASKKQSIKSTEVDNWETMIWWAEQEEERQRGEPGWRKAILLVVTVSHASPVSDKLLQKHVTSSLPVQFFRGLHSRAPERERE